jgi:hypothetical protein
MEPGSLADWITAFLALIALAVGYYTFSRQKTASDVEVMLGIFDRINSYWDHYMSDSCKNKEYTLGQILVYYENACFLANNQIISDTAFRCLSDHIYEMWTKLNSDPGFSGTLDSFISAPSTFCEIKKFIASYRVSIGEIPSWRERAARNL